MRQSVRQRLTALTNDECRQKTAAHACGSTTFVTKIEPFWMMMMLVAKTAPTRMAKVEQIGNWRQ